MNMTWTIEWVSRLDALRVIAAGEFSASAYRSMLADALADPNWYAGADSLIDYRECRLDRGMAEMLAAVDVYRDQAEAIGGGRAALVVGSLADHGSVRQFFGLAEDDLAAEQSRIFSDIEAAETWLRGS